MGKEERLLQLVSSNLKHEITCPLFGKLRGNFLGYSCKSLWHRHVFTTDPTGGLKLWMFWKAISLEYGLVDLVMDRP